MEEPDGTGHSFKGALNHWTFFFKKLVFDFFFTFQIKPKFILVINISDYFILMSFSERKKTHFDQQCSFTCFMCHENRSKDCCYRFLYMPWIVTFVILAVCVLPQSLCVSSLIWNLVIIGDNSLKDACLVSKRKIMLTYKTIDRQCLAQFVHEILLLKVFLSPINEI